jgi:CHAD domain-containing protein
MSLSTVTVSVPDLLRYKKEQLRRFRDNLKRAIAEGDVEAIHDVRVASRRLHDAMALMRPYVGRKEVDRVQAIHRRVRRLFRGLRDLDVLLLSLRESGETASPAAAFAEQILSRRRQRAWAKAVPPIQRPKRVRAVAEAERLLEAFGEGLEEREQELGERLLRTLRKRAEDLLAEQPTSEGSDLHPVRIRVKRLRYCAQLLHEAKGLEVEGLLRTLTEMQTRLGHWNDLLVAARTLARLAVRKRLLAFQEDMSRQLLELAAARAARAGECRRAAMEQWPSLVEAVQQSLALAPTGDDDAASVPQTRIGVETGVPNE